MNSLRGQCRRRPVFFAPQLVKGGCTSSRHSCDARWDMEEFFGYIEERVLRTLQHVLSYGFTLNLAIWPVAPLLPAGNRKLNWVGINGMTCTASAKHRDPFS